MSEKQNYFKCLASVLSKYSVFIVSSNTCVFLTGQWHEHFLCVLSDLQPTVCWMCMDCIQWNIYDVHTTGSIWDWKGKDFYLHNVPENNLLSIYMKMKMNVFVFALSPYESLWCCFPLLHQVLSYWISITI